MSRQTLPAGHLVLALAATLALTSGCGGDTSESVTGGHADLDGAAVDGAAPEDGAGASADSASDDAAADAVIVADSGGSGGDVAVNPVDVGPVACADAKACNDGLACTADTCSMPGEVCAWQLKDGYCLVGGVCRAAGGTKPGDDCRVCDAKADPQGWTVATDDSACDDGQTCTVDGVCKAGTCVGQPLVCGDGDPCTADVCVPGKGCQYPAGAASPCDDGNACTQDDGCTKGQCLGKATSCNDNNACTADACDLAVGCTHTNSEASCGDGDACTADDSCDGGGCVPGPKANCDDGNACTIDLCDKLAGCAHLPTQSPCCTGNVSICDDGDPCTTDLCDPKTSGCSQTVNQAVCDDGSACTKKDVCNLGKCAGQALSCDDGNLCTTDACDKVKGCVHGPTSEGKACDDGDPCTESDVCAGGTCAGSGQCACTPEFAEQAVKLTTLQLGTAGKPGQGLNLDDDNKTCAPKNTCSDGIDNALAPIGGLANAQVQDAVDKGSIQMLVEFKDFKQGPIELAIHQGELAPSNAKCDFQKQSCDWLADPSLIEALTCKPKAQLSGTLVGSKLNAGGKGTTLPFSLPLSDGALLELTLYDLRLEGTLKVEGGKVKSLDAILGGAVPKAQLLQAIDALPDEGLPISKAAIKGLIDTLVDKDIDTDGDGVKDASSIALLVGGIPAKILGVSQ